MSLTRALGELGGYSALCTIVSFVITRLARVAITRYGVSLSRTHTAIIIGSNVVWTGVMLALATFIIIKLKCRHRADDDDDDDHHGNQTSQIETDFQQLVVLVALVFAFTHILCLVNGVVTFLVERWSQGPWGVTSSILNSSVNFFIYFFASKRFRNAFRGCCRWT